MKTYYISINGYGGMVLGVYKIQATSESVARKLALEYYTKDLDVYVEDENTAKEIANENGIDIVEF